MEARAKYDELKGAASAITNEHAALQQKALAAVKACEAAEAAVCVAREAAETAELEVPELRVKRQQTEAARTARTKEIVDLRNWDNWTLKEFRRQEAWIAKQRAVEPTADGKGTWPRTGELGALHHPRRGLVGAVQAPPPHTCTPNTDMRYPTPT